MKKCTFCDSELRSVKESESARCWLCGGTEFVDITEDEIQRQKREHEKKGRCCPKPGCSIDLVENYRAFCGNCGTRLETPTLELWLRKCVEPRFKKETRAEIDRLALVDEAWQMGLLKESAEKKLDEYVKKIGNSSSREGFADKIRLGRGESSSGSVASRGVRPSRRQRETRVGDDPSGARGRNGAKSFYRRLVSGGSVTKNLIYLNPQKSSSNRGLDQGEESLTEVTNKQGTFILFVDANKGWVLPNPSLLFAPKMFASLFPDLTADEYNNFKQYIEPVEVVPAGKGRWKVLVQKNGSADVAVADEVTSQPQEAASDHLRTSFPISAADYLENVRHFANVLRPDFQRGILVGDPTGKGELVLIRDSNLPDEKQPLFLIPGTTRFQFKQEFFAYYERYYDCENPSAGDVWIVVPATVGKVEDGWRLNKRGVLEVRTGPAQPERARPEPQSNHAAPAEAHMSTPSIPSPRGQIRYLLVGGAIVTLGLVFSVLAAWKLWSGPRGNPPPTIESTVRVEGVSFRMGSNEREENERPQHNASVKPFSIDTYEVTREEYEGFVRGTSHKAPSDWTNGKYPLNTGRWPVTGVDWYDANAYCKWIGKRLPTEEEWELAARGNDGRKYPWGNDWKSGLANAENAAQGLTDVDRFKGASPYGAIGMVGNAWEWTASELVAYPGGRIPPQELSDGKAELRVIRGGSWQSDRTSATTTYRWGWPASGGRDYGNTGFRCVKSAQ